MKEAIIFKFHGGEIFIFPADEQVIERRRKLLPSGEKPSAEAILQDNLVVLFDYASGEALRLGVDNFEAVFSTIYEENWLPDQMTAKSLDTWMGCYWLQMLPPIAPHVIKLDVPPVELLPFYQLNHKRGKAKRPRENYIRVPHKMGRLNSKPKGPRFH